MAIMGFNAKGIKGTQTAMIKALNSNAKTQPVIKGYGPVAKVDKKPIKRGGK
jgi:hypothetical protein